MGTIYTIHEYNQHTGEYTRLTTVTANTREEARLIYIKENNWKPKHKAVTLFVKPPICR